jgi:restriction endonuclease Mrr
MKGNEIIYISNDKQGSFNEIFVEILEKTGYTNNRQTTVTAKKAKNIPKKD